MSDLRPGRLYEDIATAAPVNPRDDAVRLVLDELILLLCELAAFPTAAASERAGLLH